MRQLVRLVCCALTFISIGVSAPASGQIPTTRPRTTQAPPPADAGVSKPSTPPKTDPEAKQTTPPKTAAPAGQAAPKEPVAGSNFAELQVQISDALRQGQLGRALALAERQRTLYPNEMKASSDLAAVLLMRGDSTRAEPLLRAAITQKNVLYSGSTSALLGDVYMNLGQIALDGGRATDAISFLLRAIDNSPTATRARYLLAAAIDQQGDTARASREIRAAFDVDPAAARPADYRLLAKTARAGGNPKAAVSSMADAVSRFPMDVALRVDYATLLAETKQSAASLYELLHLKSILHTDAPQLVDINARILRLQSEAEASSPEPDPELEAVFSYLADVQADEHDEALLTIQDVVTMNEGTSILPRLMLGRTLKATGRFGEAERVFVQLAEQQPQSVPVLAELADLYFAEGRLEGARRTVERAEKVDPKNPRLVEVVAFWK